MPTGRSASVAPWGKAQGNRRCNASLSDASYPCATISYLMRRNVQRARPIHSRKMSPAKATTTAAPSFRSAGRCLAALEELCPCDHERFAPCEGIGTSVGPFGFVAYAMSQRMLGQLARESWWRRQPNHENSNGNHEPWSRLSP